MQTVLLKVVSAFVLAGDIAVKDDLVEVTKSEAADLLRRGKAVVFDEVPSEDARVLTTTTIVEPDLHPEIAQFQADSDERAREAAQEAADAAGDEVSGDGTGDALPPVDDAQKVSASTTISLTGDTLKSAAGKIAAVVAELDAKHDKSSKPGKRSK